MHIASSCARADRDLNAVREVSLTINATHLFVYFIPEAPEEAAKLGVTEYGPAYFAFRSAPMGAVPWQVTLAAFYNFSPRSVRAMAGVWDTAPPQAWQAARFAAVGRALRRVGVSLTADQIAEARSLIDPVVASADHAGKTMAAANASVPLLLPIRSSRCGSRSRCCASGAATRISPCSQRTASGRVTATCCKPRQVTSRKPSRVPPGCGTTRRWPRNDTPRRTRLARRRRHRYRCRHRGARADRGRDRRALRGAVDADRRRRGPSPHRAHQADPRRVHRSRDIPFPRGDGRHAVRRPGGRRVGPVLAQP